MQFSVKLLIALFGFATLSCKTEPELIDYIYQLPSINTPIILDSEKDIIPFVSLQEGLSDSIQSFLPGYNAIGVLFKTSNHVVVLFQVPNDTASPLVMVFNQQGNKVDEWLLYNTVGHDLGVSASVTVTINQDQTFELVETEKHTLQYDKSTEAFYEIDSSVSIKQKFQISQDGKFIRIDSIISRRGTR